MGILITWSLVFWVLATIIAFCALSFFLLHIAYAIARNDEAPQSIHPGVTSPDEGTVNPEAANGAFRDNIRRFGRRHSLPPDLSPPQSFLHQYRPEDIAERSKHHVTAALKKAALLHTSHGLQHGFPNGLETLRKFFARAKGLIFTKSGDFFWQLGQGQALSNWWLKHKEALLSITKPLGQFRRARQFLRRRPDQRTADELADRAN